jgi:hypothetical protein
MPAMFHLSDLNLLPVRAEWHKAVNSGAPALTCRWDRCTDLILVESQWLCCKEHELTVRVLSKIRNDAVVPTCRARWCYRNNYSSRSSSSSIKPSRQQ